MPATRQPSLFIPHGGGPCFFMDWTWGPADTWQSTERFLQGLAATLLTPPKALLVVSGHWEEPAFTASQPVAVPIRAGALVLLKVPLAS